MLLTKELIVAVRTRCWAMKQEFRAKDVTRYDQEPKAIALFLRKNPAARAQIRANIAIIKAAGKKIARANKEIGTFGVNSDLRYITDRDAFKAAGGVIAPEPVRPERVESVLARLSGATAKEGAKIIRQLGINWS